MLTVSSSSNKGYFSSNSDDTELIRQEEESICKPVLNIKHLKKQKKMKEDKEISKIIAKI